MHLSASRVPQLPNLFSCERNVKETRPASALEWPWSADAKMANTQASKEEKEAEAARQRELLEKRAEERRRAKMSPAERKALEAQEEAEKQELKRAAAAERARLQEERGGELRKAAENGDLERVKQMIKAKAQIACPLNHANEDGMTPLIKASMYGHVDVVKLLLKAKALVDLYERRGRTALMLASHNGEADVIRVLLANGAKPENAGQVALREGANDDGRTSLMLAANAGHVDAVKLLLSAGAQVRDVNKAGRSALDLARSVGNMDIATLLEEHTRTEQQRTGTGSPIGWRKLRRLSAAAQASSAFKTDPAPAERYPKPDERTSTWGSTFASMLSGESRIGASTLSWLNRLAHTTASTAIDLARSFTRGVEESFRRSSFRRSRATVSMDRPESRSSGPLTVFGMASQQDAHLDESDRHLMA